MHDDDSRFQRFVPLLRRVIILLAVLAATPVILWMITAFVRAYVGPPKVPTFHQLASTTPMTTPATAAARTSSDQAPAASGQDKIAEVTASTAEATATASDARDVSSPKGSLLGDRSADGVGSAATNSPMIAPAASAPSPPSTAVSAPMNMTNVTSIEAPASSTGAGPQAPAAANTATTAAAEASQPAAAEEQSAEVMPAAPPLTGKIPLPRHRPRDLAGTDMTRMAQSAVPMPRPRPDSAAPAAPPETTSPGPLEFIQNIFH
jgi:hypothetical protein